MSRFGPISPEELAVLRGGAGVSFDYLTVAPPRPVLTAQIAGPLTELDFPRGELEIDNVAGALSDVRPGMDVWIGTAPGASDVWVGRVRKAPVAGTLYIAELGHGDPGLARATHIRAADDHHVTVVETMSLWYAFPRILVSGSSGVVYQDWDLAYAGQNLYPPPVAVIRFTIGGLTYPHAAAFVGSDDLLTVEATAEDSFAVTPGAGVTGYAWELPAEATVVAGTLTSQALIFTVPAGAYWVQCTVTDSSAETGAARRFLRAHTRTGADAPLPLLAVSAHRDRRGMVATAQVPAAMAALADIPHGAFVLLWSEPLHGGQVCDADAHTFAGWCTREDTGHGARFPTVALEIEGPGVLLDRVPASPWALEVASTPAAWHQVRDGLNNVPGVAWWLLRWGTNLLTLFDLRLLRHTGEAWSDTRQEGFGGEALGAPSLGGQLAGVAAMIRASFGSASDGTLVLERNPCYLDDRDAWPTRIVLEAGDIDADGVAANARAHRLRVGGVQADAFAYPSGQSIPLRSIAPDWTPAQAPGRDDLAGLAVLDQDQLNAISGHHFAYINNPLQDVDVPLARMLDVIEPADMAFVGLKVTAAQFADPVHGRAWQRLFGLNDDPGADRVLNLLVNSVMVEREMGTTVRRVRLRGEGETRGDPGRTVPIEMAGTAAEPSSVAISGVTGPPPPDAVAVETGTSDEGEPQADANAVYMNSANAPLRCTNFITGDPNSWTNLGAVSGTSGTYFFPDPVDPADDAYMGEVLYRTENLSTPSPTWGAKGDVGLAGFTGYLADAALAGFLAACDVIYDGGEKTLVHRYRYSTDYGLNWTTVDPFAPEIDPDPGNAYKDYQDLDIDRWGDGVVYMGVTDADLKTRVLRGVNRGVSAGDWSLRAAIFPGAGPLVNLAIPARKPGGLFVNSGGDYAVAARYGTGASARVFKTTNGWGSIGDITPYLAGQYWGATTYRALHVCTLDGGIIFLAAMYNAADPSTWRLLRSQNAGATWEIVYTPAGDEQIYGVTMYPGGKDDVIVWGYGLVKHSADRGETWRDRLGGLPGTAAFANVWVTP